MIKNIGQIMLYVKNQNESVEFWTKKMDFVIKEESDKDGVRWIEIAPTKDSETTIVIHDKKVVEKMSPELTLATPSLMFYTNEINKLYEDLVSKDVTVGEVVATPLGKVFNFSDWENNFFAVMERK